MAFTAGFSVSVGDPTKATDVSTLAANDDFLKTAIDKIMVDSATPTFGLVDGVTATTQSAGNNSTKLATTAYADSAGAGVTLSGTTDNTVTTVTGADALQGEANMTFDGSTLAITGAITATTDITATRTLIAGGATAAADAAAVGYTAAAGLVLTGQGSDDDVTVKNDADAVVFSVATGTTNVGFGTRAGGVAPDGKVHIYDGSAGTIAAGTDADDLVIEGGDTSYPGGGNGISIFHPNTGAGIIRISSPATNPGFEIKFNPYGPEAYIASNGTTAIQMNAGQIRMANLSTAAAATDINISSNEIIVVSSSAFYKDDIRTLTVDPAKLQSLTVKSYTHGADKTRPDGWPETSAAEEEFGLIAEEVAEILPELVNFMPEYDTDEDGRKIAREGTKKPFSIKYGKLSELLLSRVNALDARIQTLESA